MGSPKHNGYQTRANAVIAAVPPFLRTAKAGGSLEVFDGRNEAGTRTRPGIRGRKCTCNSKRWPMSKRIVGDKAR